MTTGYRLAAGVLTDLQGESGTAVNVFRAVEFASPAVRACGNGLVARREHPTGVQVATFDALQDATQDLADFVSNLRQSA